MKKELMVVGCMCLALNFSVNAQQREAEYWKPESTEWYSPVPPKVEPGVGTAAPSDAIVLFDGSDLSKWESDTKEGGPAKWTIKNGELIVSPGAGTIRTKEYFGDCVMKFKYWIVRIILLM